ncbi:MAG: hypothetical protein ACRD2T_04030 [Thermoanaerobaculia bacterium]
MSLRSLFTRRPRLEPPPPFPEPFVPEETAQVPVEEAARVLAALAALRREHAELPVAHTHIFDEPRPWLPPEERFDPDRYFEVFDRLRPEEGWGLDYVYQYWGNGGSPLLYPRKGDQPPLATPEQYRERFAGSEHPYLWRLAAERSSEGAFQLALFALEGQKFYLHWHSNYFDTEVVCTPERLAELLRAIPDEHPEPSLIDGITAEERGRLRALDLRPVVRRAGDFAEVEALAFTNWGGFHRRTTRIAWPNWVLGVTAEEVVGYQCGIMF